jgi:hypothetical protein
MADPILNVADDAQRIAAAVGSGNVGRLYTLQTWVIRYDYTS